LGRQIVGVLDEEPVERDVVGAGAAVAEAGDHGVGAQPPGVVQVFLGCWSRIGCSGSGVAAYLADEDADVYNITDLENFPLPSHWKTALMPGRVIASSLALFPAVEALARRHGHPDVLDARGNDIELIHTFADKAAPRPPKVTWIAWEAP
jgi:hypothetical protein